jgi:hypothetical protein
MSLKRRPHTLWPTTLVDWLVILLILVPLLMALT